MSTNQGSLFRFLLLCLLLVACLQQTCSQDLFNSGCSSCNASGNCTACMTGYYMTSLACDSCNLGCQTCTSLTNCSSCFTGYYLNGTVCFGCTQPCSNCSNSTACISCPPAYFLMTGQCFSCGDYNCISCTLASTGNNCTSCASGYYVTSNAICQQCPYYSCETCTST
jgi:hypothetical protein